ncbi:hypothetical protein [Pseudomonas aeruginosa]|uniref:hypothetical protein n=1 Tax=Pseudomonas aeruginosa TaxID=287 RepID=UPI002112C2A8|nr:hypothetical protein [Pseudomonas aeruginosa]MCT9633274.1 hypothetical protein [Pseudomonas aeruginosa]
MVRFLINYVLVPVLESCIAKTVLRIIDIDNYSGQLLVISLEKPLKKPRVVTLEEVSFEVEQGIIRLDQDVPAAYMVKPEDEITEKEKSSREKSWHLIRGLVEGKNAGDLFVDGEFGSRVANHAAALNTSRTMIYKLLYRYWAYGQSKNVFCGNLITGVPQGKERHIKMVCNQGGRLYIAGLLSQIEQYG